MSRLSHKIDTHLAAMKAASAEFNGLGKGSGSRNVLAAVEAFGAAGRAALDELAKSFGARLGALEGSAAATLAAQYAPAPVYADGDKAAKARIEHLEAELAALSARHADGSAQGLSRVLSRGRAYGQPEHGESLPAEFPRGFGEA